MDASSPSATRARSAPIPFRRADTVGLQEREIVVPLKQAESLRIKSPPEVSPVTDAHNLGHQLGVYSGWRSGVRDGFIVGVLVGLAAGGGLVAFFMAKGVGA